MVRRDVFGDEASNKDKVNTLKLKLGGCGTNAWEAQSVDGCHSDTTEAPIDTDADCLADTWPSRGPVVPLVAACPAAP